MFDIGKARNINEMFIVEAKSALSSIEDLDYSEAIIQFQQQQMVLQAAQQSFVQIQGMSLFDYIR